MFQMLSNVNHTSHQYFIVKIIIVIYTNIILIAPSLQCNIPSALYIWQSNTKY